MAFDLLLDETTNDLVFSSTNDLMFTETLNEELRQRVSIHLQMFQGEWFINTNFGVPYLQDIISIARSKSVVDSILKRHAEEETGTGNITDFNSDFNFDTRQYSLTFNCYSDNTPITIQINSDPAKEWEYPVPNIDDPRVDCGDIIEITNNIYEYINYELPITGSSTWWNTWE